MVKNKYESTSRFGTIEKGLLLQSIQRKFNKLGKIELLQHNDEVGNTHVWVTSMYDNRNLLIQEKNLIQRINSFYEYNEQCKLTTENHYDVDGNLSWAITYEYDENHNVSKSRRFKSDHTLIWEKTYEYDERNNPILKTLKTWDEDYHEDEDSTSSNHKYDSVGNEIEVVVLSEDSNLFSNSIYKYDERRNIIEKTHHLSSGKLAYKRTYEYDRLNNLLEETHYDSNLNLVWENSYEYNYDSEGNWIRKIVKTTTGVSLPKSTFIIEREFQYHSEQ